MFYEVSIIYVILLFQFLNVGMSLLFGCNAFLQKRAIFYLLWINSNDLADKMLILPIMISICYQFQINNLDILTKNKGYTIFIPYIDDTNNTV